MSEFNNWRHWRIPFVTKMSALSKGSFKGASAFESANTG